MKTTHLFTAALVFALGSAATALAGSSVLPQVFLTAIALGDNDAGQQPAADELLKRARQAMDENNLELADSFISRAEAQNPKYGPLYMGDTPKKARADLDKKRAAKAGPNQKPSAMFAPGGGKAAPANKKNDGSTVEKDPFAHRAPSGSATPTASSGAAPWSQPAANQSQIPPAAAPATMPDSRVAADVPFPKGPDAGNPPTFDPAANVALPASKSPWNTATETPAGRALTAQPPADAGPNAQWPSKHDEPARLPDADPKPKLFDGGPAKWAAEPARLPAADLKAKSDELLRTARHALAVGDVRRATAMLEQAKTLKAEYPPQDSEPIKVENLIRKYNELLQSRTAQPTDAYRRQQSDLLLEQAQGMLRLGEADEAERLANDCQRLGLKYAPHELKPAGILEQVTAARNQSHTGSTISFGATVPTFPAGPDRSATGATATQDGPSTARARQEVQNILGEARAMLAQGNLDRAEQLVRQAEAWKLADSTYGPEDDRPGFVRLDIQTARERSTPVAAPNRVVLATYGEPAAIEKAAAQLDKTPAPLPLAADQKYPTARAVFDPATDTTRNQQASGFDAAGMPVKTGVRQTGASLPQPPEPADKTSAGQRFFQQGEEALKAGDAEQALKYFRQANGYKAELDPLQRQALQEHLQNLANQPARKTGGESLLPTTAANQQVLTKQISADVAHKQADARALKDKGEPKKAMEILTKLRASLEQAELQQKDKDILIRRVDMSIGELSKYIEENRAQIELDANNKEVLSEIDQEKKVKLETQQRLAKLVDEFNKLVHEQRYAEAELTAKKANELAPNEPIVTQLMLDAKMVHRLKQNMEIRDDAEQGVVDSLLAVDKAKIPFNKDIEFPNRPSWETLTKARDKYKVEGRRRSPKELEIEQRMTTPVSFKFQERPLEEVIKYIGQMAQVNIHLDPQGLQAEGAQSSDPVTIDLPIDISVRSALNLILAPKHLSFVIKNEVLLITSERLRDNNVTTVNYNVADLVIPIPNFAPNGNMGMSGALREGYNRAGAGVPGIGNAGMGGPVPVVAANDNGGGGLTRLNPALLHQNLKTPANNVGGGAGGPGGNVLGKGPGGLGGGTHADFDSLIELITTTVRPQSWDTVGGPGSIKGFEGTLSLVVSQTQEVHDEIADLLKQLRRLQDLQVTIEVRFITLSDLFFERIGFDFEADLKDKSGLTPGGVQTSNPNVTNIPTILGLNNSALTTGGLGAQPYNNFSPTNNIQFRQGSFGDTGASPVATVPFTTNPASFSFAILSDIEAYFLVQAAQGDSRSNILQAPKVTLFNGQQAFVSDTTQRPFVAGVVPVVGDFAAAQMPIIIVLSEGTSLTVQAVVSADRRFVRLTVVPFFSNIGDVQTFTFEGTSTTTRASSATQDATNGNLTGASNNNVTTNQGTTVQLPTFSYVTVTTTVSVPDGGTVLLGGIKRLNEGRNESGIPLLSKLPYINRLFKNTAIARSTTSLMMMVTPRIIIQEEEEDKLLGNSPSP